MAMNGIWTLLDGTVLPDLESDDNARRGFGWRDSYPSDKRDRPCVVFWASSGFASNVFCTLQLRGLCEMAC